MNIFKMSEEELEKYLKENIDTKKPSELLEELIECGLESGEVMEEDIKKLEEFIEGARDLYDSSRFSEGIRYLGATEYKAIENLINKYKEKEKIIELMAEYISIQKWGNTGSKESVIHYFEKKVGKTNGKTTRIEKEI